MAQTTLSAPDGAPLAPEKDPTPPGRRLAFEVVGHPETQGSKKGFLRGKFVVVIDDNKQKLEPWRKLVGEVATAALPADWQIIDGPVFLALTFMRHRGDYQYLVDGVTLGAAGRRREYPDTRPDSTKLARAVEDAMTGIVYAEDSRIVTAVNLKRWTKRTRDLPSDGREPVPGVVGVVRDPERVIVEVVAL